MALEPDNRVSDPGYYLREPNQIRTEFRGNTAKILGIDRTFDEGVYDRLMRGMEPELVDGKEKKLVMRLDKDRVMADDWTFNRPKSVSVAKLVGGDSRIDDVETKAEEAAMKLIESQATVKVRKKSELAKSKEQHPKGWKYPERQTNNLLYIPFRHPASREGSPHSHTHYVIFNLSFDKEERAFKAVCLKHVDRAGAAKVYRDTMRKGLNELGYKTRTVGKEYEIVGFPAEVKAKFSQRSEAITQRQQEMEARTGKPMSSKARQKVALFDRPDKPVTVPLPERRTGWLAELTETQRKAVHTLVAKARDAIRITRDNFAQWQEDIARYASQLRNNVLFQEAEAPERSRSNGRSR